MQYLCRMDKERAMQTYGWQRKERTNDMIELGKRQELEVLREKEFGVYLGEKNG